MGRWKRTSTAVIASCGIVTLGCGGEEPGPVTGTETETPVGWEVFSIGQLRAERQRRNTGFFEFLTEPSFRMGLYHLPAGATDGQDPHGEDELYYVASGRATLTIDGTDHPVEPGSTFFVRAAVDHAFHSITSDLDVLVVFVSGASSTSDPASAAYTPTELVSGRDPGRNVWAPFFTATTMTAGMYLLPQSIGGDGVLTHTFDEINIVTDGAGTLEIGDQEARVAPGTIVFVEAGRGHRFRDLDSDLDVMIFWER